VVVVIVEEGMFNVRVLGVEVCGELSKTSEEEATQTLPKWCLELAHMHLIDSR
jgi:hypothetical protein